MKPLFKPNVIVVCLFVLAGANLFSQPATDSGYVNVDGGKLFYEAAGKGENIVLLHDGMVHREIWDEQFPVLARNYRVVRYDRRTYGKSSDPQAPYSHIEDLNQLFIQLKIDKAIVFGMSSGGGLAIDFILKYPDKVTALVLVGAVVGGYGYSPHMMTRGGHAPADHSDIQKMIKYYGWDDPYEIYSENIRAKEKFAKLLAINPHMAREKGVYPKPANRPAARFLAEIKVPALVLVGEHDIPDVHAHAGVIEFGIPNAKRQIILKSGHLIPMEQPEAFNAAVLKFLHGLEFYAILHARGAGAAAEYFLARRGQQPDVKLFDENEMNRLGYTYLQEGKIKDAIELLRINTVAFPDSANVFDSLGEAYMKDGQNGPAIVNYEKSLLLNPNNANAKDVLAVLKKTAGQAAGGPNLLKAPESIIYDKAHQRYLLSNYETGNIIQVDGAGKQGILVENMVAIQGLEIVGNVVYVGARNSVRGFDLETGAMVMNVPVQGVSNLNDVTADDAGNLYAGDVFGTKIIKVRIKDSSYSVFVDGHGIDHPNGIFFDKAKNRILVCSYRKNSPIQAISLADATVTTLADTNISECDGIVLDKYGSCYVTSWETLSIYRFDNDFSNPPAVIYKNSCGPADISYDGVHDAIAVPLMTCNSYEIVPVDPPQGEK
ncbi:MAG: alpha/beta fold hydrolase [Chrysiogenales bacterium]